LSAVLSIFNEATISATSGKLTFGTIATIWSASAGISAIQDTLNAVFKLKEKHSYFVARIRAILLTILITGLVASGLSCIFLGDFTAAFTDRMMANPVLLFILGMAIRVIAWSASACILALSFAVIYYWAPDWEHKHWRWLTSGIVFGISGWLLASLALRVYLHFFKNFTFAYGSLGAVIILLTWFYISGLMLVVGAEIDWVINLDWQTE
jgi:membrane protein